MNAASDEDARKKIFVMLVAGDERHQADGSPDLPFVSLVRGDSYCPIADKVIVVRHKICLPRHPRNMNDVAGDVASVILS